MDTITILIIVIVITIILFSSFNVSYSSDTPIANTRNNKLAIPNKINNKHNIENNSVHAVNTLDIGKYNPKASSYALYNLPEKDPYMTPDLKNQIDTLRTQYYYDNCAKSTFQQ